ncbi:MULTISPECIES: glycosyltransferase family 4 protein [Lachnospiraceae]|jgi:glycosyltransferase involved in cell wall biosynthesis|uniref:N-acetyl-alpha-D-glucosaminyl L-malate synthase BshA n=2 Tax=Dorea TaxID=189330 RepID=A0A174N7I3_9FIRM|nr:MULTISPECIES: glycosyltransferase family 4 protein [Lachnospiraceae]MCU6740848.1 glycosyltransferase family 4 protein [Dorea amylophila]RHL88172.1 glycosyltransferase [Dorea formicigenerans]CUP44593.1 N-acetyl-alpha-D-glucosaminyl L-malate synthase BshA [Dorea longicatena]
MKVMIIAPYIYDDNIIEFTKNKTGFGIMVQNIVSSVAELENVILLTRVITKGKNEKNFKILSHTWGQFFSNAKLKDWLIGIKAFFANGVTVKDKARHVFYEVDGGYVRKQIQKEKPDIVHIHGIGTITESYIRICEEMKVRYTVTLHGLIGLNDSVSAPAYEKQIERDFLIKAEKNNIPISVISSGMKARIEEKYLGKKANNITVITNGTKKSDENDTKFIREEGTLTQEKFQEYYSDCLKQNDLYPKLSDTYAYLQYSKKNGKKILFFVGNITKNKNQMQAVEILKNTKVFENILLVLWGREVDNGEVRKKIAEYQLHKNVILGGFNDRMDIFWKFCDVNLFLSLNDGFGLPIVEGYMHGVPCVTFEDLDATQDLYYPEAMLKVKDRSNESVTDTLKIALDKNWKYEEIIEIGNMFSIDIMSEKYVNWYKEVMA